LGVCLLFAWLVVGRGVGRSSVGSERLCSEVFGVMVGEKDMVLSNCIVIWYIRGSWCMGFFGCC